MIGRSIISRMAVVNPQPAGSSKRAARARATRRRIAEAALVRFSAHGYAATTMEAIASDAGVAVQTVYFVFHTKAELLIAALTVAGGGPDEPEEVTAREWLANVAEAPSGPRRLALIIEHGNEIYRRVGPLLPAVQAAASTAMPAKIRAPTTRIALWMTRTRHKSTYVDLNRQVRSFRPRRPEPEARSP